MYTFEDLKQIMKTLRAEDGCPWDRAQDHDTLKKHLVEECAEVLEAIDAHDTENLCEELGDVLFQVMFHSEIEAEQGNFTVDDVVNGICEKMIRRHPRVFGGEIPEVENEKDLWEAIKKQERAGREEYRAVPVRVGNDEKCAKTRQKRAKILDKECRNIYKCKSAMQRSFGQALSAGLK